MPLAASFEPDELNAAELTEWRKLVAAMPDIPPEGHPLIAQMARHIVQARWYGRALQQARDVPAPVSLLKARELHRIELLSRAHDKEGKAMMRLSTRLRFLTRGASVVDAAALFRKAAS